MKKKIFVRAPVLSQSGYGEQSRFALRALRSQEHLFDIYVQPIPWGQTGWIWQDDEFRGWMDSKIAHTQILLQQKQLQPDMNLIYINLGMVYLKQGELIKAEKKFKQAIEIQPSFFEAYNHLG